MQATRAASVSRCSAATPIGAYSLLRLERGGLEPGIPGQFFMLEVPGRVLPRPMSLSQAPAGELGFLMEPIGVGDARAVLARARRRRSTSSGHSGTGST